MGGETVRSLHWVAAVLWFVCCAFPVVWGNTPAPSASPDIPCETYATNATAALTVLQIDALLKAVNGVRKNVVPEASQMYLLRWNELLANVAQNQVSTCPDYQVSSVESRTNNPIFRGRAYVGESLAIGTQITPEQGGAVQIVDTWHQQRLFYTYGDCADGLSSCGTCEAGRYCGDYVNLVWAATTEVGCGYARCDTKFPSTPDLWMCYFSPGGNLPGTPPYVKGKSPPGCQFPPLHSPAGSSSRFSSKTLLSVFGALGGLALMSMAVAPHFTHRTGAKKRQAARKQMEEDLLADI